MSCENCEKNEKELELLKNNINKKSLYDGNSIKLSSKLEMGEMKLELRTPTLTINVLCIYDEPKYKEFESKLIRLLKEII